MGSKTLAEFIDLKLKVVDYYLQFSRVYAKQRLFPSVTNDKSVELFNSAVKSRLQDSKFCEAPQIVH